LPKYGIGVIGPSRKDHSSVSSSYVSLTFLSCHAGLMSSTGSSLVLLYQAFSSSSGNGISLSLIMAHSSNSPIAPVSPDIRDDTAAS
jgi:hypothetical protein